MLVVVMTEEWDGGGGGSYSRLRRRMGSVRHVLVLVAAEGWQSFDGGGNYVIAADGPAQGRGSSWFGRICGKVVASLQFSATTYRPFGGLSV